MSGQRASERPLTSQEPPHQVREKTQRGRDDKHRNDRHVDPNTLPFDPDVTGKPAEPIQGPGPYDQSDAHQHRTRDNDDPPHLWLQHLSSPNRSPAHPLIRSSAHPLIVMTTGA